MRKRYINIVLEFLGWTGVIAILLAYGFNNFGVIDTSSLVYIILNIYGATGIIVDALEDRNFQPVILNIVWLAIAVIGLLRTFPIHGTIMLGS